MSDGFKMPSWSARNPLGIIALFISLIYGMSALLFGSSVDSLEGFNETALVLFLVSFPFVVLSVFGWLVVKHHTKLYGPGDYKSDQSFMDAIAVANPEELGERLRREVEDEASDDSEEALKPNSGKKDFASEKGSSDLNQNTGNLSFSKITRQQRVARAYQAESLVFQELQNELGGAVRREVVLPSKTGRSHRVDGIIQSDISTTIVDVKMISDHFSIGRLLEGPEQMLTVVAALKETGAYNVKFLYAVVIDFDEGDHPILADMVDQFKRKFDTSIEVRTFNYGSLLKKYGFFVDEN